MKILMALVLSCACFNSFAQNLGAVEKFTSYLPVGSYSGVNDQGIACQVEVSEVNFPKKDIQVRIIAGDTDLSKLIETGSRFAYKDHKREFIQTERSLVGSSDSEYVERIIRTINAGDNKQYITVSYSTVVNRETNTEAAECVVNL